MGMSDDLANHGGDILLTKTSAQSITASNGGDLTVSSNANTIIESVTFDGAAMSGGSTISMSGSLTNSGGNILLTKGSAQSITANNGGDLTVSSNSNTIIEGVTFDGA